MPPISGTSSQSTMAKSLTQSTANQGTLYQLQKLRTEHKTLDASVSEIQKSYGGLGARYAAVHPAVVSNPLVHYTHRQLLSSSFNLITRDEAFCSLVDKMYERLDVAKLLLKGGQIAEAGVVLMATKERMSQAEKYLGRLEEGVKQHEEVEAYLREKGLMGDPVHNEMEVQERRK